MSADTMLCIVAAECRDAVKECKGGVEERLRAAMGKAKNHWMVLDQDTQLRGAIGSVLDYYGKDSEEFKRIEYELNSIRKFTAYLQAAQAGLSVEPPDFGNEEHEAIGILKMWREELAK